MVQARNVLIGIDLGTHSVKVVAFRVDGTILASSSRSYPTSMPHRDWSEQKPEDWWKATTAALRSLCKKFDHARILALSLAGQMHGSVFLDRNDQVIRPSIVWNDNRTAEECRDIIQVVGRKTFLSKTRNLPLTSFTLPRLIWLKKNEKGNYRKLRSLLLPKDYIRFRLTGVKSMDVSDASGTVMMRVGSKRWATRILDKLNLDPGILPVLTQTTDVVGHITQAAHRSTGIPAGTLVVAGAGRQPAAAVASGVFNEGQVMVSLGTSGVLLAPTREVRTAESGGLASFDHAVPGSTCLVGCVLNAGGALRWFRDTLCMEETAEAQRKEIDVYDILMMNASSAPAGSENLFFMPYLTGERTPHNNPYARGVWFGLTPRHTRDHMIRSIVEGITYGLRDCLELVRSNEIKVDEIRVTGGGARSRFWLQMIADVFGLPVRPVPGLNGGAIGAAILAGIGTGIYEDFEDAADRVIRTGRVLKPALKRTEHYQANYERFRELYQGMSGLFHPDNHA
jgi:xylulokinase